MNDDQKAYLQSHFNVQLNDLETNQNFDKP